MPMDLLLPIIWIIAATVVGLLGYRIGTAIYVREDLIDTAQRKTRQKVVLGGGAFLAVLAFLGAYYGTPTRYRTGVDPGEMVVRRAAVEDIARAAERSRATLVQQVTVCISGSAIDSCKRGLEDVVGELMKLEQWADTLAKPK